MSIADSKLKEKTEQTWTEVEIYLVKFKSYTHEIFLTEQEAYHFVTTSDDCPPGCDVYPKTVLKNDVNDELVYFGETVNI